MPSKQKILERIFELSVDSPIFSLSRSLLHAYIACLTPREICSLVPDCFEYDEILRKAIKSRIFRIADKSISPKDVEKLSLRLIKTDFHDYCIRAQAEALISRLYPFLLAPTRQAMLDRWRDKGTRSAGARWLKAISSDELLYSVDSVLQYWQENRDWQAAKVLAYRAPPVMIRKILPELIQFVEEGWIIGAAVKRAGTIAEEDLSAISSKFPATYAYICAITNRKLSVEEAIRLIYAADEQSTESRGLAIWAIGQLGMIEVLDQIRAATNDFHISEMQKLGIMADLIKDDHVSSL